MRAKRGDVIEQMEWKNAKERGSVMEDQKKGPKEDVWTSRQREPRRRRMMNTPRMKFGTGETVSFDCHLQFFKQ